MRLKEIVAKYPTHEDFLLAVAANVLKLADEKPDFQYSPELGYRCSYNGPASRNTHLPNPDYGPECSGCILGQALQLLGWDETEELETRGVFEGLLEKWGGMKPSGYNRLLLVLRVVQSSQDTCSTWSKAIVPLREYLTSLSANIPAIGE
jgi:hypothetical protein